MVSATSGKLALPPVLTDVVLRGEAILFLGAGASIGAKHPTGQTIPKGNELRDALSEKYLGGAMKDRPLATVAQLCENESSRNDVQQQIRDIFVQFEPAPFHLKIPNFRWHSIITTNYDLIIDKAYEQTTESLQSLVPFYHNGQMVEREARRVQDPVQFLKLHGCIDHIGEHDAPLILTNEQYVKFLDSRTRLFSRLQDWAKEFPIVFCGYAISDPNVQAVLFDLFDDKIHRPMYYAVLPGISDFEARYWLRHRITPIDATFETFLENLDAAVPATARALQGAVPRGATSLTQFYARTNVSESSGLLSFLAEDVLHLRSGMPIDEQKPDLFYKGYDTGFGAVSADLDVPRAISDEILLQAVLAEEGEPRSQIELFLIKGAAGNGKTTVLKRTAWDAAHQFEALVLWVRDNGAIRGEAISEIFENTQRRIFLFVDRAALRADQLYQCLQLCKARGVRLSVVTAERDNEWNTRCESIDPLVTDSFPVRYLNEGETDKLLDKLSTHNALGLLKGLSKEQQKAAFLDRAQRQLLVALHEATQGKPFEDIVVDEYARIVPDEARLLYLDICTLNRLGVGVRAGVISRVSSIDFSRFKSELFHPLAQIVFSEEDKYSRDRIYRTRHPHVAEIVFAEVLKQPEQRLEQIVRIMRGLNIDYTVDREAFNQLARGRNVADSFSSVDMGRAVFKAAREAVGDEPFLRQQEGIFELTHVGGNINRAGECFEAAERLAPNDRSIQHSMANWLRRKALDEPSALMRQELRGRALSKLGNRSSQIRTRNSFEINTRLNVLIDELKEALPAPDAKSDKVKERVWVDKMRAVEEELVHAHQRFPNDEHLLMTEVAYRQSIADEPRAQTALERAFSANPRLEWIAVRLADVYEGRGELTTATAVLVKVTTENPGAKQAHLRLGRIRSRSSAVEERAVALQHFRSSFSNGDTNYEAQFLYGRELFLLGKYELAQQLFDQLRLSPVSPSVRNAIREPVAGSDGNPLEYRGIVQKRETSYVFISSPSHGRDIFGHVASSDPTDWTALNSRDSVRFEVGFSYRGPQAISIRRI
jgi:tetratricopeptide (TPR) repeat protein/cold shock CspA family protein